MSKTQISYLSYNWKVMEFKKKTCNFYNKCRIADCGKQLKIFHFIFYIKSDSIRKISKCERPLMHVALGYMAIMQRNYRQRVPFQKVLTQRNFAMGLNWVAFLSISYNETNVIIDRNVSDKHSLYKILFLLIFKWIFWKHQIFHLALLCRGPLKYMTSKTYIYESTIPTRQGKK